MEGERKWSQFFLISQQQQALRRHSEIGGTENNTFFRLKRMGIGKEEEKKSGNPLVLIKDSGERKRGVHSCRGRRRTSRSASNV